MKLSVAMIDGGEYTLEEVVQGKLVVHGEFDMYDKAIREAKRIIREKGAKKGDQVWNWDGTFWEYTGRNWKAYHVSD